ncbi:hypothetical protein HJFPF1_05199 [Paramyrothecium foliicola]|nr:hypothetical protein HJFPF1_05199 [Paramyrothecium foliicola]
MPPNFATTFTSPPALQVKAQVPPPLCHLYITQNMPIFPLASRLLISALHPRRCCCPSAASAAGAATAAELTDRGCANLGDELASDVELTVLTRLNELPPPPTPETTDSAAEPPAADQVQSPHSPSIPVPRRRHARADSVSTVSSTASFVQGMTPSDRQRRTAAQKAWTEYW